MNVANFELEIKAKGYKVEPHMQGTSSAYFEISKDGIYMFVPRHKIIRELKDVLMNEIKETYNYLKERRNEKN